MLVATEDLRLTGLEPGERATRCGELIKSARQALRTAESLGRATGELLHSFSKTFDDLLISLCEGLFAPVASLSLVAMGGYGRGRLYPYSDLDLLLLHGPGQENLAQQIVEQIIYPLWDARVSVSCTARSVADTLDMAGEDLTIQTSLLDLRLILGSQGPYLQLQAGAYERFFRPERMNQFVEVLRAERATRHARFGETVYLLEPNVKNGKGGLRDLSTALWVAKARYGIRELSQLLSVGAVSERQLASLDQAWAFLRRLRFLMHLRQDRAQEQLLFETQEVLAQQLFPVVDLPGRDRRHQAAVQPAVERLMHAFYRHARTVAIETEGILERCRIPITTSSPAERSLDQHFSAVDGHLKCNSPRVFWEQPAELLRAYELSLDQNLELARSTIDTMAEAAAAAPGAQLLADDKACESWLRLLCADERSGHDSVLEEMHEIGLLTAVVPEFEPCTGRVQHDLYHVYTVDHHSLYVLGMLKALKRGDLKADHPLASAMIQRVRDLAGLYLAALLHDVGKPLGSEHSAKGARLAAGVAARLQLPRESQEAVAFLVRHHLAMIHVSQRRDLSDEAQIDDFVRLVGTVERLEQLFLLSLADAAMTAPGNLNQWKRTLLEELYSKSSRHLAGERPSPVERTARVQRLRADLRQRSTGDPVAESLVERLPDGLFLTSDIESLQFYLAVGKTMEACGSYAWAGARPGDGETAELVVCSTEQRGLLATVTGVFLLHRIEVLAGQGYNLVSHDTARASAPHCEKLNVFWVKAAQGSQGGGFLDELAVDIATDLCSALSGELSVSDAVTRRTKPSSLPARVVPEVKIKVRVDNDSTERASIVEVEAPDCRGLLHVITRTLAELNLEVDVSRVATEAGRIIDIFYVRDAMDRTKIRDAQRLRELVKTLEQAVQGAVCIAQGPAGGASGPVDRRDG
jgi:[protein-PII] uridylyltransferase